MASIYDCEYVKGSGDFGSIQIIAYSDGSDHFHIASMHIYTHSIEGFTFFYSGALAAEILSHPERLSCFTRNKDRYSVASVSGSPNGTIMIVFECADQQEDNT